MTYDNGCTYKGDFNSEKQKHGSGVYTWMVADEESGEMKTVATYDGAYADGKKNGLGKMTFPNGDEYHGDAGYQERFTAPTVDGVDFPGTLALSQACERPDGGKYPCNDPSQLLDRILSYISIEADQTDAPPFTLDSDPKDVLRWMSTAVETIKLKVRQDVERAHRVPHLAEEECSRLRAMPPGHAAECYRAVATMSALARPY